MQIKGCDIDEQGHLKAQVLQGHLKAQVLLYKFSMVNEGIVLKKNQL